MDRDAELRLSKTMKAGARYYRKGLLKETAIVVVLAVAVSVVLHLL